MPFAYDLAFKRIQNSLYTRLLFFMMLFAKAGALEHTGVASRIATDFGAALHGRPSLLLPVLLAVSAVGSAFVDNVVFVAEAPLLFRTRKVRLGARHAGAWEVIVGVAPGELVVTRGSALLRSEILKSRLGAGCAGE